MLSLTAAPLQTINCTFTTNKMIDIFGFSFESDSGVFVDNFSFRGNSGMPLTKMNASVLRKLNSYLDYDLIVLQYGINVVNNKVTDFSWYQRGMNEVVSYLKNCFPNTSILLISAGDKSYRDNGKYETDPSVLLVVDAQRKVAEKNQIGFWNLYAAMGGKNSMVKWVEGDTVYANKDYTHLNFRGAKRVANLFYERLLEAQKQTTNHRKDLSLK